MNLLKKIKCKLGIHQYELTHNNPVVDYYREHEIQWMLSSVGIKSDSCIGMGPLTIGITCLNCEKYMLILIENLEKWEIIIVNGECRLICKKLRSRTDHEIDTNVQEDGK